MPQLNFVLLDSNILFFTIFLLVNFGAILVEQYEDDLELF